MPNIPPVAEGWKNDTSTKIPPVERGFGNQIQCEIIRSVWKRPELQISTIIPARGDIRQWNRVRYWITLT
ncbi:hypothetical protein TNCV_1836061 [Trichonephila clavipes]|nr:hypothetical protein TNCV_1836061 [Trichonephila clavipes]